MNIEKLKKLRKEQSFSFLFFSLGDCWSLCKNKKQLACFAYMRDKWRQVEGERQITVIFKKKSFWKEFDDVTGSR